MNCQHGRPVSVCAECVPQLERLREKLDRPLAGMEIAAVATGAVVICEHNNIVPDADCGCGV